MKTLIHRHPIAQFRAMEEALDQLFSANEAPQMGVHALPIDVTESAAQVVIRAAVPGLDPDHLDIQVENGVLTLRGELPAPTLESGEKLYRRELNYGKFARSVRLPENVDVAGIAAEFKFGLVTVTAPRVEPEKPQPLRIAIKNVESKAFDAPSEEPAP